MLVKLSIVSLAPLIASSVAPPWLIATEGVSSRFGGLDGKSYWSCIWLQVLKTVCLQEYISREFRRSEEGALTSLPKGRSILKRLGLR